MTDTTNRAVAENGDLRNKKTPRNTPAPSGERLKPGSSSASSKSGTGPRPLSAPRSCAARASTPRRSPTGDANTAKACSTTPAAAVPTAGAARPGGGRPAHGARTNGSAEAGPGRGGDRGPGKSAHALGGDLEERGHRRRSRGHPRRRASTSWSTAASPAAPPAQALGRSRASHYRHRRPPAPRPTRRPDRDRHRALTDAEADDDHRRR